jgi:RIO-like serine/threonine protein kinase
MVNLSGNSISTVWRQDGWIYKRQIKFLCENEFWCLNRLSGTGYVPTPCQRLDDETIRMKDLGESEKVSFPEKFIYRCQIALGFLAVNKIRHGDLTEPNIIVKDNSLYIIDFAESRLWDDPRPDKRPEGDAFWLKQTMDKLCAKT